MDDPKSFFFPYWLEFFAFSASLPRRFRIIEFQYDFTRFKTASTSFSEQQRDYMSAYHRGDFRRYLITATIQLLQEILQRRFTYFDTVCEFRSLAEEAFQIHSDKVRRLLFILFKI